MIDQQQSQTNPLGPMASAAKLVPQGDSVKPAIRNPLLVETKPLGGATDPDTDGRRTYSPDYGKSFANRGASGAGGMPSGSAMGSANGNPLAGVLQPQAASDQQAAANPLQAVGVSASMPSTAPATNPLSAGLANGRGSNGVITAESAAAASANPMTRSGGISGSYDGKGVNEIMVRENAVRQEMINNQITQPTPTGPVAAPVDQVEIDNAEKTRRWAIENAVSGAPANQRASLMIQAMNHDQSNQTTQRGQDLNQSVTMAAQGIAVRGQDVAAKTAANHLAGNPLDTLIKGNQIEAGALTNASAKALSDLQSKYQAETDPAKQAAMAEQIRVITGKGRADTSERLSLPQQRSNAEIDAARNAVSGLTPQEIQRKTAKTTNTGRENPDFDPTLERAVTLAGRRKVGSDDHFDGLQGQHAAGDDGDVTTRFKSDQAMTGHALGKQTELGTEVLDRAGKLIGHYR